MDEPHLPPPLSLTPGMQVPLQTSPSRLTYRMIQAEERHILLRDNGMVISYMVVSPDGHPELGRWIVWADYSTTTGSRQITQMIAAMVMGNSPS